MYCWALAQCELVDPGLAALQYLSRYLYRGVISDANLIHDDGDNITFRYQAEELPIGALMTQLTTEQAAELHQVFDACDSNGDGFITPEEFLELLRLLDHDTTPEECLLDFQATDTEGDGFIGFKEFVAWWTG